MPRYMSIYRYRYIDIVYHFKFNLQVLVFLWSCTFLDVSIVALQTQC